MKTGRLQQLVLNPYGQKINNDDDDTEHADEEQEATTQTYDFMDGAGYVNVSAPLSSSLPPRYNLSTPFLVECLRQRWVVPLQPMDGEFHLNFQDGERVFEDSSKPFCSLTMVLPSNKMLAIEWSTYPTDDLHAGVKFHHGDDFGMVFPSYSFNKNWDRKVFSRAGVQLWMDLNMRYVRQSQVIRFSFALVNESTYIAVESAFVSPRTGYVQSRGFDWHTYYFIKMTDVWTEIRGPPELTTMISVPFVDIQSIQLCTYGNLSISTSQYAHRQLAVLCSMSTLRPFILGRSVFYVHFRKRQRTFPERGFRLLFSFHEKWARLPRVSRQWNCSVVQWPEYRHHFPCNLFSDCVDGVDEDMCPYSSFRCGPGQFLAGGRCYVYVKMDANQDTNSKLTFREASLKCQQAGGILVSVNNQEEWDAIRGMLVQYRHTAYVRIGLKTTQENMPRIYGNVMQLTDNTVAYYYFMESNYYLKPFCTYITIGQIEAIWAYDCNERMTINHICEIGPATDDAALPAENRKQLGGALMTSSMFTLRKGSAFNSMYFATCPNGHLTHAFLACDFHTACWMQQDTSCSAPLTPLPPSFSCGDRLQRVPYTVVCDFRSDCIDNSDEGFCHHPPCLLTQFTCQSGQCLRIEKVCDYTKDCEDGSDETYCTSEDIRIKKTVFTGPAYVNFTRTGYAVLVPFSPQLNHSHRQDMPSHPHPCPDQYFACESSPLCFPVYTRCNDVYDCPGREDESDCDGYKCPGLFRCRGSSMCVAPSELCDGIYHCPQHDDELLCAFSCPATCMCYGLAFFCRGSFSFLRPDGYQQLRYLDASDSGLQPSAVVNNTMLIYLRLASCGLIDLEPLDLPNLHSLDLSDNLLTNITDQSIFGMTHLKHLILAGNLLTSVFPRKGGTTSLFVSRRMLSLDLSRVIITELHMADLNIFPNLKALNLSDCRVDTLQGSGMQSPKLLRALDVRGCPMTHFQADFFLGLSNLKELFADNYKLCCSAILPPGFNPSRCIAPSEEISSCDNLLRSHMYRVFLALFAALALTGNSFVFISRVVWGKPRNGFDIFTITLCLSDFLMGIYLAVIGVADRLYLGSYLWNDVTWRHSITCSLAGFLSMVSNEVSAFTICLITLDRFLVLRFPFSNVRFNRTSGIVMSGFLWMVGVVLAAVPLLPFTTHWQFYSVNGICVPLPITRKDFPGQRYSFSLMIVLNFVLFLLVAVGQLFIYLSVQKNSMQMASVNNNTNSNRREISLARRLILIAVTDFVCWFPIGLLGILASSGESISGEVNVAMAIFVLPLNSAINPFLYTVNKMLETRRVKKEQRLMNRLLKEAKQTYEFARANQAGIRLN